jgi:small glutamine-rich tetratricopeptide repeat-containing protein alpha
MTSDSKSMLAYAICSHLKTLSISEDDQEGIEVAIQCISNSFGIDMDSDSHLKLNKTLQEVFDTHLALNPIKKDVSSPSNAEAKAKAEILKGEANKKMAAKSYKEAIALYTKAIELHASAVFYANRSAAYSQNQQFIEASKDGQKAIDLDSGYSKGYARLGLNIQLI